MAMIDLDNKQIVAKIVICGPGQSGKTTFLKAVHDLIPEKQRRSLTSIEDELGTEGHPPEHPIEVPDADD